MRGLLWQIVAGVVSLLFVGLLLALLAASSFLPVEPWVQVALAGALMVLFLFAFVAATLGYAMHRARILDPAFASIGLRGRAVGINGRAYRGEIRGRRLIALYHRGSRGSMGPMLDISVDTTVMTKLAVGTRTSAGTFLADALGLRELSLPDPAYARFIASAEDSGFAMSVLLDRSVMPIVLRLVTDPSDQEMRTLAWRPGAVRLWRRFFDPESLSAAELTRMVDDLSALAEMVEKRPAPAVRSELGALERSFRESPGQSGCLIAGMLVAIVLVVALATGAMVFAMSSQPSGPTAPAKAHPKRR